MAQPPDATKHLTARQWLWLHPLVPVAVMFAAGLAAGRMADASLAAWLMALLVAMALYIPFEFLRFKWSAYGAQMLIAAGIFCFGGALYTLSARQIEANNIAHWLKADPIMVDCRARVISVPRKLENADVGIPLPEQQFCIVAVDSIRTRDGWTPASGDATLRAPAEIYLKLGDRVEITGLGRLPAAPEYPGSYDYRAYLASSGIHATLWVRNHLQVSVISSDSAPHDTWQFSDLLERYRQAARAKIQSHIEPQDSLSGDALQALVLGYRTAAMRPITQAFADAGVAHLLAISGSHIVLVAGIVWLLLHPLAHRPRWRVLLMLGIVWCYVAATPAGPPIMRAAITLTFFALATLASRPMHPLNILAGALIVCLLIDPMAITDAGMQLSFAATFGLLVLSPRLHSALIMPWAEYHAAIARAIGTRRAAWWFKLRYGLLLALLANFIGSMISTPLVAYHFCQFNPLATFSGVLALPIVSLSLIVGLIHLLVAAMGSSLMATPAVWCAAAMNKTIFWLAQISLSSVVIRPPPLWLIAIIFLVLLLVILRRQLCFSRAWTLLILLAALVGSAAWYPLTDSSAYRIWTLGRTAIIQNQHRVIVMNPGSDFFVRNKLDPFLRRQGIARVDALILPHPTSTASAGSADLARRFHTPLAMISQQAYLSRHYHWTQNLLIERLQSASCRVIPCSAGDEVQFVSQNLHILWPPKREIALFSAAQSPLMLRLTTSQGDLFLIPEAFPDSWPMSPESELPLSASAIILTGGTGEPVPGIPMLCRDDRYGAYELRDGQLIEKTK